MRADAFSHDTAPGEGDPPWAGALARPSQPPSAPSRGRRLAEPDRPALAALCDSDPCCSIFLADTLARHGLSGAFARFWGAFDGERLIGALMIVGRRAAPFAIDDA